MRADQAVANASRTALLVGDTRAALLGPTNIKAARVAKLQRIREVALVGGRRMALKHRKAPRGPITDTNRIMRQ